MSGGSLGGLVGDDLVFDLVVDALGQDAAGDELVFGRIGPSVDDALGIGVADAGDGFELVCGGGVDVDLVGSRSRGGSWVNSKAAARSVRRRMRITDWNSLKRVTACSRGRVREWADCVNEDSVA
jgi:hypothetical protein